MRVGPAASGRVAARGRLGFASGAALAGLAVFGSGAEAAGADGGGAAGASARLVELSALLAPLGISPFLALAAIGWAAHGGHLDLPAGVRLLTEPALFGTLFALGLALELGKSSKLTRPFAEGVGTSESVVALGAAFVLFAAEMTGALPEGAAVRASTVGAVLFGAAAGVTVGVILALRVLFDVLIWLSPVPFIDLAFELTKSGLTVGLVALAAWMPFAAMATFALVALAALLLMGRAIRAGRMALTVLYDNTLGQLEPAAATQLPVVAFADRIPGTARHAKGHVAFEAGTWRFVPLRGRRGPGRAVVLGADEGCRIHRRWAGLILDFPRGRVLLPPRYGRSETWLRSQFR